MSTPMYFYSVHHAVISICAHVKDVHTTRKKRKQKMSILYCNSQNMLRTHVVIFRGFVLFHLYLYIPVNYLLMLLQTSVVKDLHA